MVAINIMFFPFAASRGLLKVANNPIILLSISKLLAYVHSGAHSSVRIKLWGTRGSLPRPMNHHSLKSLIGQLIKDAKARGMSSLDDFNAAVSDDTLYNPLHFGGQTTCSEVSHGDKSAFVDMGTGITDASVEAMQRGKKEFTIFQTHFHWDHIMGLPFFVPIYVPDTKVKIYHVHPTGPEHVRLLFRGLNFPVKWDQLGAEIEFVKLKLYEKVKFGEMTVSPFALDHPDGSFGYRFDCKGKSVAIGVDGEYKRLTPKELGKDLPYYQNLDLLIFDAQYAMDELAARFDYGHSSPPIGVDLALREGIRNLVLTHHDPRSDESKSRRMVEQAIRHCKAQLPAFAEVWKKLGQPEGPRIQASFDGLTIDLDQC